VLMRLPVRVSGEGSGARSFQEDTYTLAISAHGALISIAGPVYRGQRFTLSNMQTKATLGVCCGPRGQGSRRGNSGGVEFMLPNETFWRVAFPPKDWTPRHPDAKSGGTSQPAAASADLSAGSSVCGADRLRRNFQAVLVHIESLFAVQAFDELAYCFTNRSRKTRRVNLDC